MCFFLLDMRFSLLIPDPLPAEAQLVTHVVEGFSEAKSFHTHTQPMRITGINFRTNTQILKISVEPACLNHGLARHLIIKTN